jgi:cytochrome o ubiquinol oxidase operon protein cyoD
MKNSFEIIDEKLEASKSAMRSYVIGFFLSVILTAIPYYLVVERVFDAATLFITIALLGVVQLIVQVIFFLHLHKKSKPHWNMIVFSFTLLIVAFLVIGSLWIMYHLNVNMMGVSPFNSNEGYIPQ